MPDSGAGDSAEGSDDSVDFNTLEALTEEATASLRAFEKDPEAAAVLHYLNSGHERFPLTRLDCIV